MPVAYVSYCATTIISKSVFLCSNGSIDKWVSNLSFLNVCISVSCLDGEDLTSFYGVQCLSMYYHVHRSKEVDIYSTYTQYNRKCI